MKRLLAVFLALVLCLSMSAAYADTVTQDGLEVTLSTDKQAYDVGDKINLTLTVKNTGDLVVKSISAEYVLPDTITASSQALTAAPASILEAGKQMTFNATFISGCQTDTDNLPQTGDSSHLLIWLMLCMLAVLGCAKLSRYARRRFLAFLLCVITAGSMMLYEIDAAGAESGENIEAIYAEAGESEIIEEESERFYQNVLKNAGKDPGTVFNGSLRKLIVTETVEINGQKSEISVAVEYSNSADTSTYQAAYIKDNLIGRNLSETMGSTTIVYNKTLASGVALPASAHNHGNNLDQLYIINGGSGTSYFHLFFNSSSYLEPNWDALLVYDAAGNYVTCFTGSELSNANFWVNGNRAYLRLVTDISVTNYGFAVNKAVPYVRPSFNATVTSGGNRLTWTMPYGFDGYVLSRAPLYANGSTGTYTTLYNTYYSTATSYTDTSAVRGQAYKYHLQLTYRHPSTSTGTVVDFGNYATTSGSVSVSTPTGFGYEGSNPTNVTLKWNPVSGSGITYQIWRSSSRNGTYSLVKTTTNTTETVGVAVRNAPNYYKLRAYVTVNGERVYSPYTTPLTAFPMPVPGTLTGYSSSTSNVTMTWSAVSLPGRSVTYQVWRSGSESGPYTLIKTTTAKDSTLGVVNQNGYNYYKVRAYVTIDGKRYYSGYTNTLAIRPLSAPTTPTGYSNSASSVHLSWSAVPANGATYQVYRSNAQNGDYTLVKTTTATNADVGVGTKNALNYYKVRAYIMTNGKRVYTPYSGVFKIHPMDKTSGVKATAVNSSSIKITWTRTPGATGYYIYRSSSASGTYSRVATVSSGTTTSYTNTGLSANTKYFYRVAAYNSTGVSPQSNYSYATTSNNTSNSVTYRALIIGQTYPGTSSELRGPGNDQDAMRRMLNNLEKSNYQVTLASNLTATGILNKIGDVFGQADSNDVTLFYYSGHGLIMTDAYGNYLYTHERTGSLCGTNHTYVSANDLRNKMDQYQGKKVVIIDACHSGNMIGKGIKETTPEEDAVVSEAFVNGFMSAFDDGSKANLAASNYYVLTAASKYQSSYETLFTDGRYRGVFTYVLTYGSGWNCVQNQAVNPVADVNNNGWITLDELYDWTLDGVDSVGYGSRQTVQVYPTNSSQNILGL